MDYASEIEHYNPSSGYVLSWRLKYLIEKQMHNAKVFKHTTDGFWCSGIPGSWIALSILYVLNFFQQ